MIASATFDYARNMTCQAPMPDGRGTLTIAPAMRPGHDGPTFSPMSLLALAHGTCMVMMMGKAAKAAGLDVQGMKVEMKLEMSETSPPQVSAMEARFLLPRRFGPDELARLKAGAETCPVHRSFRSDIPIKLELVLPQ